MRRLLAVLLLVATPAAAEIRRDPPGVNVNASSATTVLITFGGLQDQEPVEALWCLELVPAAPDIGQKCAPGTVIGRLPLRHDQSRLRGGVFTDVMSIPASVSRRAYEAARSGSDSTFFYVRRFRNLRGGPDEFVFVTCRLSGGGARSPLALLDVRINFAGKEPVPLVRPGEKPPALAAQVTYNGTGRLRGRWEVVSPGEAPPGSRDLLPEGALPAGERAQQRRYPQVDRFNVFLPPSGRTVVPGPDPARLPTVVEGMYLLLFRVEATDDREADSNLARAGAGEGVLHSGGVAGFPMPVVRYYVGSALPTAPDTADASTAQVQLLSPPDAATPAAGADVDLHWRAALTATVFRVELLDETDAKVFAALLQPGAGAWRVPSWVLAKHAGTVLKWRVVALGPGGTELAASDSRTLRLPAR